MRDGKQQTIRSEDLVRGDIIVLEAGDAVPADGRILECASMKVEEAALTGESVPVLKTERVLSLEMCIRDRSPWKDENGDYKFEGRFNQGVVSLNLPQIGILAKGDEEVFWKLLDCLLYTSRCV